MNHSDRCEVSRHLPPRSARAATAKRSRSRRLRVSTRNCLPVSGSTSHRRPWCFSRALAPADPEFHRDDVVAARQLEQRPSPVLRPAEVRYDDDQRALSRHGAGAHDPFAQRGRARPVVGVATESRQQADEPTAARFGGIVLGWVSPKVTMPSRLPRRVARCPIAIATPSVMSAFRRSAVPNCIDNEVSSTSQVTSTPRRDRRARAARSCGRSRSSRSAARHRRGCTGAPWRARSRFRAGSSGSRRVVFLDAPRDRDVEGLQQPFRHRPGTGRAGLDAERSAFADRAVFMTVFMRARSSCGAGTAASTCSRIASGLTSSASAW